MAGEGWFPGWYVTRLHFGPSKGKAACGAYTSVPHIEWQAQRARKDLPKCKKCLKKVADMEGWTGTERFVVRVEVEVLAASAQAAASTVCSHLPDGWPLVDRVHVQDSTGQSVAIELEKVNSG